MAAEFRENVCGRVVAMLSRKEDAHDAAVADLVRAVSAPDAAPLVIPKPTVRADLCIAMVVLGAVAVLLYFNVVGLGVGSDFRAEDDDQSDGDESDQSDDDDGECGR